MREYKFRGKRKDNGDWVYGYYLKSASAFIAVDDGLVNGHFDLFEVDPETVGQYTEMLDKNSKKAYEGDIIKAYVHNGLYPDEWIAPIIFKNGKFGIEHGEIYKEFYSLSGFRKALKTEYVSNYGEVVTESEPLFEVIGNIYENPERLKEGSV